MSEYSQGVCEDGAAILRDGQPLTIEEILEGLRQREQLQQQNAELAKKCLDADGVVKLTTGSHMWQKSTLDKLEKLKG